MVVKQLSTFIDVIEFVSFGINTRYKQSYRVNGGDIESVQVANVNRCSPELILIISSDPLPASNEAALVSNERLCTLEVGTDMVALTLTGTTTFTWA